MKAAASSHKFEDRSFMDLARFWIKVPVLITLFLLWMFIMTSLADALIQ
jgi:hypothetical protein